MDSKPGPVSNKRRAWVIALAAAAGLLGALAAPKPWKPGAGRLVIERGPLVSILDGKVQDPARVVFDEPVAIGATAALERDQGRLRIPNGVPVDGAFVVELDFAPSVYEIPPLHVRLTRADGVQELVPARYSDRMYVASRRAPQKAWVVLGLLGVVIVLWISAIIPLFVTSLAIPVVLAVAGAGSAQEVLAPFFDPIIVLFFAGFVLAEAMRRVELDRFAAVTLVAKMGTSPVRLFAALIGVSAFLSMWMSNTAAVTVLLPVALAITAPFAGTGYRRAAVLGIAYAATIGGVGSAIGTPANQLAIRFVRELGGPSISFVEWFLFGVPLVAVFLPLMGVYLWRTMRVRLDPALFASAHEEAVRQRASLGDFTKHQRQVLAVFVVVVLLWLTQGWHGWNTGIVALGGAVVLFAIGRVVPADLTRISWPTLLTFGGGLTLGVAMVNSGVSDWVVTRLGQLAGVPPVVGVFVVAAVALVLTTVASNTAAAATLIPLSIPLAGMLHIDPTLLAVTVATATSIDFALVIGTPPTMLAYGTGMFTPAQILRRGLPLDGVGLAVLVAIALTVWPLVLGLVG